MKELTFVVQGKVQGNTRRCLESIRQFYPQSKIILSTWVGEPFAGLEYDAVVQSEDPGAIEY
jgi:hypothetical protein